jgi:hypothetical protein
MKIPKRSLFGDEEALAQLRDWGYDPSNMSASNFSEDGYERLALDENGKRQFDGGMENLLVEFVPWLDKAHYDYIIERLGW